MEFEGTNGIVSKTQKGNHDKTSQWLRLAQQGLELTAPRVGKLAQMGSVF